MSDLSSTFPLSEKITNILDVTLYEAREKSGLTVLDETVRQTMAQMMEVREAILQRIKCLRIGASNDSLRRLQRKPLLLALRIFSNPMSLLNFASKSQFHVYFLCLNASLA